MTTICLEALRTVVADAEEYASRWEAKFARTLSGYDPGGLMAPLWRFSIKRRPGGPMLFRTRTNEYGPVDLLRLSENGENVEAEALLAPPTARIANPQLIDEAHERVEAVLDKIARMEHLTCSDQARVLYQPLNSAAILLLDPDTVARQRRIEAYIKRMRDLHKDEIYYDMMGFAYHGGGPGLGKRA